jgi:hypothetical protein
MGNALAHLRSNAVAYLALFVALGGSAYAAAKIDSGDVENNSLKSGDLKNGKAVKGADVKPDSLTGAQINERTLDTGRAITVSTTEPVALEGSTGIFLTGDITVNRPSTLLATATAGFTSDGGGDDYPRCQLYATSDTNSNLSPFQRIVIPDSLYDDAQMTLTGGLEVAPGTYSVELRCDIGSGGAATIHQRGLIAWTVPD